MNWKQGGPMFLVSDPAGFIINRANVNGNICYMAVKLGKPSGTGDRQTWDGSEILHVERNLDPWDDPARLAALDRCKAACEEAANVR